MQNIAVRCIVVRNDYPVMSCEFTMERDIVMVDLNNTKRRLPETCDIRIGKHEYLPFVFSYYLIARLPPLPPFWWQIVVSHSTINCFES